MVLEQALQQIKAHASTWITELTGLLPELLLAVFVIVVFGVLGNIVQRLVSAGIHKAGKSKSISHLIGIIVKLLIILAGIVIALEVLNLEKTVTSLLAGAGIIGLALGFAFQDIAANLIAGIFISLRKPFREGDIISTSDVEGVVKVVSIRTTEIKTFQGQDVLVPNKDIFGNVLTNFSTGARRVDLQIGVGYGDDLEHAESVAISAIKSIDAVDNGKPIECFWTEFGGSSVNGLIFFWIDFKKKQPDFLKARSEAIKAIKKAFEKEGISIPFPITTLDFGPSGGVSFKQMKN